MLVDYSNTPLLRFFYHNSYLVFSHTHFFTFPFKVSINHKWFLFFAWRLWINHFKRLNPMCSFRNVRCAINTLMDRGSVGVYICDRKHHNALYYLFWSTLFIRFLNAKVSQDINSSYPSYTSIPVLTLTFEMQGIL